MIRYKSFLKKEVFFSISEPNKADSPISIKKDLIMIVKSMIKGRTNVHKMVLSLTVADLIVSYIVIPLEIGWRISVQVSFF